MIFGKQDTHVPREGRDLIRKTLEDANVPVSVSFNIQSVGEEKSLIYVTVP